MAEAVKEDGFAPAARTYIGNAFLSWQEEEEVEVECEPLVMQAIPKPHACLHASIALYAVRFSCFRCKAFGVLRVYNAFSGWK